MSVPANSLMRVLNAVSNMVTLRSLNQQVKLSVGASSDATLTDAERDVVRARLQAKYDALAAQVKTEVDTNW